MADEDEEEILDSWEDALDSEVYYFYKEYNLHLLISLTYVLATVSYNTTCSDRSSDERRPGGR